MIAPDKAAKLLEEVVLERIMSFVDLKGLCLFQQELEVALIEVGVEYDEVNEVAREMVDDELRRLADDPRYEAYGPDTPRERALATTGICGETCVLCEEAERTRVESKR